MLITWKTGYPNLHHGYDVLCFNFVLHAFTHSLYVSPPPPGAIGQLLDSLEEIQVLTGANDDDVNFLQNFFEHQTLQALLEVRKFVYKPF